MKFLYHWIIIEYPFALVLDAQTKLSKFEMTEHACLLDIAFIC